MLHYQISPKNLGAHLIHVIITVPAGQSQIIAKLPKWIPGSYKIRDYSRHLQAFSATANGQPLVWKKADSDTWVIEADEQATTIEYDIYAYDLSVRGAYLDDTRFFFNHCCVCLDVTLLSEQKRTIDIQTVADWRIFTALNQENNYYVADSYEQQIDCPMESSENYLHSEFEAGGITHEVVFTGTLSDDYDMAAMTAHLQNICQAEMKLFGGTPLDKYLFMTYVEPNQYGGLEHKNSVAQMASPEMMMKKGDTKPIPIPKNNLSRQASVDSTMATASESNEDRLFCRFGMTDKMIDFMGLCSHEYFHLWNVKRLQPKDFQPYELYREQNTEMLWMFEGFTSYYDELFLLRAGVVDAQTFLKRQAQNLTRVLAIPGRKLQPLAASSFDAWTKLYQADANSPNNMVSYYSKGAVFALFLDLFIRQHSDGKSLDDVMRYLWSNYGEKGIGIDEDIVFTACGRLLPSDKHELLAKVFVEGLHGKNDMPFTDSLAKFGVTVTDSVKKTNNQSHSTDSGLRLTITGDKAKVAFLDANSHAGEVGVSVDDEILAIDNRNALSVDFNQCLNFGNVGQKLCLTLSRRGRVFNKTIQLAQPIANEMSFILTSETALGKDWLSAWI